MIRKLFLARATLAFLAAGLTVGAMPAMANHHGKMSMDKGKSDIHSALMHERRAEDKARDKYRHPAKTLQFFDVQPDQTVVEYGPGGGWYTRILLPYLAQNGTYIAINADSSKYDFPNDEAKARIQSWPQRFPKSANEWTGVDVAKIHAFESDELPEAWAGKVDRIVIFRSLHGMLNGNRADSELRLLRDMLADDGTIGIVQHRARPNTPYAMSKGTRGYLKQKSVIALFELNGFKLVGMSEINANPKDKADYPKGVWTLPPVRRFDKENDAKYQAIGETDRMTLLFKKAP